MKNIIIALISLGSAGFGAVLAYFLSRKLILQTHLNALKLIEINHANAIQLLQKTGFNKASADFRSAFVTAIRLLEDPAQKVDAYFSRDIFLKNIDRHNEAYILFRHYLSDKRRSELDEAWNVYNDKWSDYFSGGSVEKQKEDRKVLLERIKNLTSLAT